MNKYSYFLSLWLFGLLLALPGRAQYISTPPQQDGQISDAEYGNTVSSNGLDSNKLITATDNGVNSTWYMTWDANNLYVAKTGGKTYEPNIMYFDLNPQLPVTGGSVADGSLTGNLDYGVTPKLPFRGDVRVYFTDGYVEVRRFISDGVTGYWSAPITTNLSVSNTGTNREVRLSWNTLTGSTIPAAFNWQAYTVTNASEDSNFRYDLAPSNPSAAGTNGKSTPPLEYYYTVGSTANGTGTKPFILKSYTFLGTTNLDSFGPLEVWDFTMNSPGLAISRGNGGGDWTISGSLVVSAGTLYFGGTAGGNFGNTTVGNIRMLGQGVLKMDQTDKPLNVREDVMLTGGSQFQLSGVLKGDLNIGRDLLITNGTTAPATFLTSGRTVTFTGNSMAHRIRASNNYLVPFDYLTLNTPSGTVTLDNNIAVGSLVTFTQGLLITGSNSVELYNPGFLGTETTGSHLVGNVHITQDLVSGTTTGFGNLGLRLLPQNGASTTGSVTLYRVTGSSIPGVGNSGSIQRSFQLVANGTAFASPNFMVEVAYRLDELNGIPENNLALYQSLTSASGPYTRITTPPSANTSTHTLTYTYQTALAPNTYLTAGNGATTLPVTLVSFTAQATAQGAALLHWVTASEVNSKGFGIERQLGNGTWQSVGYVASGYANGGSYDFTDKSLAVAPASAQAYYRLRQEDLDGTLSYSPVAVVARPATTDAPALVLSPVPVSGPSLSVAFAEASQAGAEITVSNTQGQRMLHFTTETSTNDALSLPVEKLAPGVYIVHVQVPGQNPRYARFVKQ
ncbi:MAG: T9SS type A sorting domain-containing protein [Janthinobacterium lividum]